MSWKVPVSTGGGDFENRENCPPGEYPAVVVALIDLGHQQKKEYQGTAMVWRHMIAVVWECQGPETTEGEPFYFAEEYGFSLAPASNFVKKCLARGGIVVPETGNCDISELLGRPFLLTVEEAEGKQKGNPYSRLAKDGVAKLPQMMHQHLTEPVRPPFCWQLDDGLIPHRAWLPYLYGKRIDVVMAAAREFQTGDGEGEGKKEEKSPAAAGYQHAADRDDIPF